MPAMVLDPHEVRRCSAPLGARRVARVVTWQRQARRQYYDTNSRVPDALQARCVRRARVAVGDARGRAPAHVQAATERKTRQAWTNDEKRIFVGRARRAQRRRLGVTDAWAVSRRSRSISFIRSRHAAAAAAVSPRLSAECARRLRSLTKSVSYTHLTLPTSDLV